MRIDVEPKGERGLRLKITGEDFTLGNLIQEELIGDSRVEGAGVFEAHPLDKSIIIQVFLKQGDPKEVISDCADQVIKRLAEIKRELIDALKAANS